MEPAAVAKGKAELLQELQGMVKAGDAAAENLDVPELKAMEAAAELYQQALQGFSAAGLTRPKLQAKLDSANDRIADLLLSAPAPAPAVDWEDLSDSGVLAQLNASGFTGSLACTEQGREIQTTFDEASAFGAWDLTQEMSAMTRLVRSKGTDGKLAGVSYAITERIKETPGTVLMLGRNSKSPSRLAVVFTPKRMICACYNYESSEQEETALAFIRSTRDKIMAASK
jgi:hypothetical protein